MRDVLPFPSQMIFVLFLLLLLLLSANNAVRTTAESRTNSTFCSKSSDSESGKLCVLSDDRSAVYLSVPENTSKGTSLGIVPVVGNSSAIRLRLVGGQQFVRLDASAKLLVLRRQLDREATARFEAVVECSPILEFADDECSTQQQQNAEGALPISLNISVFVAVTDVNDNAPRFPNGGRFSVSVPEELAEGTPIVGVDFEARDADQPGPNSRVRYRVVGVVEEAAGEKPMGNANWDYGDELDCYSSSDLCTDDTVLQQKATVRLQQAPPLAIPDPFRPALIVSGRIDFEQRPNFIVLIEAEDQGKPKLKSMARLEVTVQDVDDLNPFFSHTVYRSRRILDDNALDVEPGIVRAWDGDRTINETIVYALAGGDNSEMFAIDQRTGVIKFKLKGEKLKPATLIIQASQMNRPERSATALLVVEITTKNDADNQSALEFKFEKDAYEFVLDLRKWAEESDGGQQQQFELGQVRAVVRQQQKRGQTRTSAEKLLRFNANATTIQYSLLNGNRYFEIDSRSGILFAIRARAESDSGTNSANSSSFPGESELVIAANHSGQLAFARCVVRAVGARISAAADACVPRAATLMQISPALLPLGALCFLLLVTNCATLSLWLGKKRFQTHYGQLAYRYNNATSVEGRAKFGAFDSIGSGGYSTPPFARGNYSRKEDSYGSWMLNRSLEGVSISAATTTSIAGTSSAE